MNCPHCQKLIDDKLIARYLASTGGKKSKRILTTEQAQSMVKSREAKKAQLQIETKGEV